MPSDRDQLISFGFEPARVDWALKATGNKGLQPAMDFLLENDGKPIPDSSATMGIDSGSKDTGKEGGDDDDDEDIKLALQMSQGDGMEAKSIKCSECGKIFRNTAMAEFHAEKSGHDQFEESTEEIKPLTAEEKAAKLAELRAKMAEKRAKKSAVDEEERKANEALRRKAGKDTGKIREELRAKEAMKEAEQRRKDKIADAKARAEIKAQIEADKKARAEKAAREKAERAGKTYQSPKQEMPVASTSTSVSAPEVKKEYNETRLQLRLSAGGAPLTVKLPSENTLQDVAEYVASQSLAYSIESIKFATNFPRKTFSRDEWGKTLKELGLTPSAVCSKATLEYGS